MHSSAIYNKLLKTQHQILVRELAKIEKLNAQLQERKKHQVQQHGEKMEKYTTIIEMLRNELAK